MRGRMLASCNPTGSAQHGINSKTRHLYLAETRHLNFAINIRSGDNLYYVN